MRGKEGHTTGLLGFSKTTPPALAGVLAACSSCFVYIQAARGSHLRHHQKYDHTYLVIYIYFLLLTLPSAYGPLYTCIYG